MQEAYSRVLDKFRALIEVASKIDPKAADYYLRLRAVWPLRIQIIEMLYESFDADESLDGRLRILRIIESVIDGRLDSTMTLVSVTDDDANGLQRDVVRIFTQLVEDIRLESEPVSLSEPVRGSDIEMADSRDATNE